MMNGYRESDILILSEKSLNKVGDNKLMAEKMEKRRVAERNPSKQNRSQTQSWIILPNELDRIRHAAETAGSVNSLAQNPRVVQAAE